MCVFMCEEVSVHVFANMMAYIYSLSIHLSFLDANQVATKLSGDTVTRQPGLAL